MKLVVILFLAVVLAVICTADADTHHLDFEADSHQSSGGGVDNKSGKKYSDHKHTKKSGKRSKHNEVKGRKGIDYKELQSVEDEEGGGKKTKFHTQGTHKSYKKSGGGSAQGLKYEESSDHKKNNLKKGFREKYHKDEKKNHDSFFSNSHKSGEYKVFGKGHEKHSAKTSAKKQGSSRKKGKSERAHAKSAKKVGGHSVVEKKGHQQIKGSKGQHSKAASSGKKGGNSGGKQHQYETRTPDGHK
ncbi:hornerin [Anoplophora glabripennis]|nr:hornerin [Anoplophora glabripennis]